MLVAWWRHQNKKKSASFNTDSFWWTFDELTLWSFCERNRLWTCDNATIDNSAVRIRKCIFAGVLISSFVCDKLFMTEIIKSERAYNHVCAWHVMMQSKWKYFFIFLEYWFVWENTPFCLRKYWWLKIPYFFNRNDQWECNHAEIQLMKKVAEDELYFQKPVFFCLFYKQLVT